MGIVGNRDLFDPSGKKRAPAKFATWICNLFRGPSWREFFLPHFTFEGGHLFWRQDNRLSLTLLFLIFDCCLMVRNTVAVDIEG